MAWKVHSIKVHNIKSLPTFVDGDVNLTRTGDVKITLPTPKEAFDTGLVKKEDLFITTKLWNSDHGHVVEACKDGFKKLQLDYLDSYLAQAYSKIKPACKLD
ncbi:putative mannose-6-phosphate 6-reductase [Medicago truncatula]|uniref:Putative mannose-6-phosphate 6-reductase n=1 Tax=Medicago truncatula TaxID=3880 RepID=A0A396HPU1_MEDTR|nr:putative mannose-6-phosphate 6-reductase [Medicago truncatula]